MIVMMMIVIEIVVEMKIKMSDVLGLFIASGEVISVQRLWQWFDAHPCLP